MDRGLNDGLSEQGGGDSPPPAKGQRTLSMSRPDVVVRSSRALGAEGGRPIVVVLGMHRSGTSLLANILQYLGVDMADTTDRINDKNAGGYWERPELFRIHDQILAAIDRPIGRASHAVPFPPAWWRRKDVQALKPALIDFVERQLARSNNLWGFKDPRTCRLLPLWWEIFRELDLRPLYVHAVRAPSEASVSMSQQSSARNITVATGELMWLTYNYDVVRYVTAEHPTVVIDYDEWFSDGNGVAQRLIDQLGIGDDLTAEDVAECVASIVKREYRHQFGGASGAAPNFPLATMLYKAITAGDPPGSSDARGLRGQLRLVDLFLKSLSSITEELDAASAAQAALADEQRLLLEDRSAVEQVTAEALAARADELSALVEQQTAAEVALNERDKRIEALEAEQSIVAEKMTAARGSLELAKQLGAKATQVAEQEAKARQQLAERLALREQEGESLAEQLQLATGRGTHLDAQLVAAREELRLATEQGSQANEQLAVSREELRVAREEDLRQWIEATHLLEGKVRQRDRRAGQLLAAAKAWRAHARKRDDNAAGNVEEMRAEAEAIRADLADRDLRHQQMLVQMAALRAALAEREQHSSTLDDQYLKITSQLDARDRTIAALAKRDDDLGIEVGETESGFQWPVAATDPGISGHASSVDGAISGEIFFADRSDIVPIVEVRVGTKLLLAQACIARPLIDGAAVTVASSWSFEISWSRVAEKHAGGEAIVRVAGFEVEVGRVPIPTDLRRYKLAPALLAAEVMGGTIAEAATYHRWIAAHETASEIELARAYRRDAREKWPRITIIIHGHHATRAAFAATLRSLRVQVFGHWEALCVGAPDDVVSIDARVRTVAASELADELGQYRPDALISFVEANDRLAPTALLHLARAAEETPDFALIYSDEDRIDPESGVRALPYMKGDWSVDLALVQDYVSRLALLHVKRLTFVKDFAAAQFREAVLRSALAADGAIVHLPFVLYHRAADRTDLDGAYSAVVAEILAGSPTGPALTSMANGQWQVEWPLPDPTPRVSLIVPTRDRVDLLRVCVEGFLRETHYDDLEILIADNDSAEEETLAYLAKISSHPRVRVIASPGPFNYSAINNLAATHATGTIIGLMNNDLKVIEPDWLRTMVAHVMRSDVGIVGAKLLHGDDTVQHAGVTLGISIASHLYKSFARDAPGHYDRLLLTQDVSAVTAACLLIRKDVWEEVGGLDEEFPVAYNDIDLCLKVRQAGYRVLWTPAALVYHLESQSRGTDLSPEKRERLDHDKARLTERWGARLLSDPFHSPNLSDRHVDGRLAFPSRVTPPWRNETRPSMKSGKKA